MRLVAGLLAVALLCPLLLEPASKKKKKKDEEEITQTLEVPKDPPPAITVDARRLVYFNSPLSAKGLLSQQTRDAIKALFKQPGSPQIVKLRALTAGTGDLRRIQAIVSETFTEKKLPLPTLTVVQTGALPLEGAQVLLEATALAKKPNTGASNVFIGAKNVVTLTEALSSVEKAASALGATSSDILKLTCWLNAIDNFGQLSAEALKVFPKASVSLVQARRLHTRPYAACEAAGTLNTPIEQPWKAWSGYAVATGAPRLVLSGTQMAFRAEDTDIQLAFDRLGKTLQTEKATLKDVIFTSFYSLSGSMIPRLEKFQVPVFEASRPPASGYLEVESLPSMDASFGMDVVAVAPQVTN